MAKWNPPVNVGGNELIGRRLFDEPLLAGAGNQPSFSGINLNNFIEKRDKEFSVDRLGASGVDKKVIRYLEPRCDAASTKLQPKLPFHGWFTITAKDVAKERKSYQLPVVASPEVHPPPDDNLYHAHLVLPNEVNPHLCALHLRHVFVTYGKPLKRQSSQQGAYWSVAWQAILTGIRAAQSHWRNR